MEKCVYNDDDLDPKYHLHREYYLASGNLVIVTTGSEDFIPRYLDDPPIKLISETKKSLEKLLKSLGLPINENRFTWFNRNR